MTESPNVILDTAIAKLRQSPEGIKVADRIIHSVNALQDIPDEALASIASGEAHLTPHEDGKRFIVAYPEN